MGGLSTRTPPWRLLTPPKDLKFWVLLLPCCYLAARGVLVLYLRYWCNNCQELFCFRGSFITGGAVEEQSFRIRGSDGEERVDSSWVGSPKGQILWLTRTAGSAKFWRSRLRGSLLPLNFAEGIETRYQQLRFSYPDNSQFKNNNERIFEPNGLVWSSNFSLSMNRQRLLWSVSTSTSYWDPSR